MRSFTCDGNNITYFDRLGVEHIPKEIKRIHRKQKYNVVVDNISQEFKSDFHLMTMTVMRNVFKKMHLRVIIYKSYRDFSNEIFLSCLSDK